MLMDNQLSNTRNPKTNMGTLKIIDTADEFRIEIAGQFIGSCVNDVETRWHQALSKASSRRVTVDIARLSGYENPGRRLLRRMHKHGTTIAAPTPRSLIFLAEITATQRRGPAPAPTPIRENAKQAEQTKQPAAATKKAAAGD